MMHFEGLGVREEIETLFGSQDLWLQQLTLAEARAHLLWEDTQECSVGDVFREWGQHFWSYPSAMLLAGMAE